MFNITVAIMGLMFIAFIVGVVAGAEFIKWFYRIN